MEMNYGQPTKDRLGGREAQSDDKAEKLGLVNTNFQYTQIT